MAGIIYSNGVSLVHWALGFGLSFVKWPDIQKAIVEEKAYIEANGKDKFESNNPFEIGCEQLANNMTELLLLAIIGHFFCGVLNIYREVFETKLGIIG